MESKKSSKTLEMTIEVITRSTVKVVVEVPDDIGLNRYGDIGQALFEATPSAMFDVVERHFERVSFDKSGVLATIAATVDGEGQVNLAKCTDKVELELEECGSLDEDGHFVFCTGHDDQNRPVITWPVSPSSVISVVAKVIPFTEEKKQIVLRRVEKAFEPDSLPEGLQVSFQEFEPDELKYAEIDESYAEVFVRASVQRSDFILSSWDEFSNFAFGIFAEDPCNLIAADIRVAVDHYMADRAVVIHSVV